jgi:hypothetical protein
MLRKASADRAAGLDTLYDVNCTAARRGEKLAHATGLKS